jgi:hypothetical protein
MKTPEEILAENCGHAKIDPYDRVRALWAINAMKEYADQQVNDYKSKYSVVEEIIIKEFYNICDMTHADCNANCPVYKINKFEVPDTAHDYRINRGCDCFKNGSKMLEFIMSHKK